MAVLNRTAHILEYLSAMSEGYRDRATGDWVDGKEEWVTNYCKCDIVPAGKANQITIPTLYIVCRNHAESSSTEIKSVSSSSVAKMM